MTLLKRSTAIFFSLLAVVTFPIDKAIAQIEDPSPELQRAERLLQTADELADADNDSVDPVLAAYEQALVAYGSLDDPDTSLSIYEVLADLNYADCRDPQALAWSEQALQFIAQLDESSVENFGLTRQLRHYRSWSKKLGDLHRANERPEDALAAYKDGLLYGASWPQSALNAPDSEQIADLLRSQLPLIPPDSAAADETEQRLIDTWQLAGAIEEVDGLLNVLTRLADEEIPAPESLLVQTLETSRRHGYRAGELRALLLSSQAAIAAIDYNRAEGYAQQALELTRQLRYGNLFENEALYALAQAAWGKGDLQAAIDQYQTLLEKVNQTSSYHSRVSELEVVTSLVALYRQTGQSAQAQTLIDQYGGRSPRRLGLNPAASRLRLRSIPYSLFSNSGSLPYRNCDRAGTESSPFQIPAPRIRRRGQGLRRIQPRPFRNPQIPRARPRFTIPPAPNLQPVE